MDEYGNITKKSSVAIKYDKTKPVYSSPYYTITDGGDKTYNGEMGENGNFLTDIVNAVTKFIFGSGEFTIEFTISDATSGISSASLKVEGEASDRPLTNVDGKWILKLGTNSADIDMSKCKISVTDIAGNVLDYTEAKPAGATGQDLIIQDPVGPTKYSYKLLKTDGTEVAYTNKAIYSEDLTLRVEIESASPYFDYVTKDNHKKDLKVLDVKQDGYSQTSKLYSNFVKDSTSNKWHIDIPCSTGSFLYSKFEIKKTGYITDLLDRHATSGDETESFTWSFSIDKFIPTITDVS